MILNILCVDTCDAYIMRLLGAGARVLHNVSQNLAGSAAATPLTSRCVLQSVVVVGRVCVWTCERVRKRKHNMVSRVCGHLRERACC